LLCLNTTEFNRTNCPGSSAAAAAAAASDGLHQTVVTGTSAVSTELGAKCSTSNRWEYVLSNHCWYVETGNIQYSAGAIV